MATKLINVNANFEFVVAIEKESDLSIEHCDFSQIRTVSDSAIKQIIEDDGDYVITIDEIESYKDIPDDWCGQEVPFSPDNKENRKIEEILEANKNMNKNYNVNIKITF